MLYRRSQPSSHHGEPPEVQNAPYHVADLLAGLGPGDARHQRKLQLETDGRVSCVVVVQGSGAAYRALSTVSVADGGWHRVRCTRRGAELTIEVDGSQPVRAALPPGLVFENDAPLQLGGNSNAVDNDQYSGELDKLFFRLGGS